MSWTIGVDVGGTFTDFYGLDEAGGAVWLHKRASTPDDPGRAIVEGIEAFLAERDADVRRLAHGTTVGTNALIQRKGGRVALVTTRGFRDLLEIGRQIRPHMYDLYADFPPPLVPRERRFEVSERILADGSVHRPLDQGEVEAVIGAVRESGAEACAVCFLFGYLNPAHEAGGRRAAAGRAAGGASFAVVGGAAGVPRVRALLDDRLERLSAARDGALSRAARRRRSQARLPAAEVGINQSSGGLMSLARAAEVPIRTALSGPAAGAIGAVEIAAAAGMPDVITLDMGGTSADVALIRGGRAAVGFDRQVADFPIRLPMVDIHTVGAGGGSIAWFDRDGLLKVGPQSAGAVPGPACYGQGGVEATVTDANLVLGRLAPSGLLGGAMALDEGAARDALAPLATRLGFTPERTAHGLLGVVAANMVRAIRTISVERGHDPRRFVLMPFGGAGPLHARDVAAALGIRRVLVPAAPGILCAQGLVVSDLKEDFVAGQRLPVSSLTEREIGAQVEALRASAEAWLEREEVPAAARDARAQPRPALRRAELRAAGGVRGRCAAGCGRDARGVLRGARDRLWLSQPGRSGGGRELPADRARPALSPAAPGGGHCAKRRRRGRKGGGAVFFAPDAALDTPVYQRGELLPGQALAGPAVIEQLDATTLLFPGDRARVDGARNLLIELAS